MILWQAIAQLVEAFRAQFGASGCEDLREAGNRAVCVPYVRWAAARVEKYH